MQKKALITGITGQDGSYLAELLLSKRYKVYGMIRRSSVFNTKRIDHLFNNSDFKLIYGDMADTNSMHTIIRDCKPDEIYNLAAQSHVKVSFEVPEYTCDIVGMGVLRLLETIRQINPNIKFYQASSSEMMGKVKEIPQKENTPFYPRSPYGCAKVFGYWITINYREAYKMFACNGILYNHESPRRLETFVTRKITKTVADIKKGKQEFLSLGNLDSKRDWGHSKDYVNAMWMILQQDEPDDYIISTGETHSVREFLEESLKVSKIPFKRQGKGIDEVYIRTDTNKVIVKINKKYFRPAEVDLLQGNANKAKKVLGWKPKIKFKELVKEMVEHDLKSSD